MTAFFDRIREELQQLAKSAEVEKVKEKASHIIHQAYIPVPLTSSMIQTLIVQAQLDDVQKIKVEIMDQAIRFQGVARKLLLKIPFTILLKPASVQNRILMLTIVEMTPINQNWLNGRIFHHPPHLLFQEGKLHLDLNEFEVIRQLNIGIIKDVEIKDNKVWLKIGV